MVDTNEANFRRNNQWYSFTGAVYNAIGGAAFFGALMTIAQAVIAGAAGVGDGAAFAAALMAPAPILAIGGLMALGAVSLYMGQREGTTLKTIQDEHMAQETARCMGQGHAKAPVREQPMEYPQNCRSTDRTFVQDVHTRQPQHVGERAQ